MGDFQLIVDLNKKGVINDLFNYLNYQTIFSHVKFNGLPYYERSNIWSSYDGKRPIYDPDIECDNDIHIWECTGPPSIFPTKYDVLRFVIEYHPFHKNLDPSQIYTNPKLIEQISKILPQNILLVGYETIKFYNPHGYNEDHRGSDHCKIRLPFNDTIERNTFLTLQDFAIIYYTMKSHKWDTNYEMFCGATHTKYNHNIFIRLEFDHGS